jgi:hypothetical protein
MPATTVIPEGWNFTLVHGDTWPPESFVLRTDQGDDIVGFTTKMSIYKQGSLIKTLTETTGFVTEGAKRTFNPGIVDLPKGVYKHEIEIRLPNGDVHTQYNGSIRVLQDLIA